MSATELAQLEQAERMLAQVATATDAVQLIRLAEAARVWARQAHLGNASINHATVIKLRAERKLADAVDDGQATGEIATTHDGGRPPKMPPDNGGIPLPNMPEPPPPPATLADIGVDSRRLAEARLIRDRYTDEQLTEFGQQASDADEQLVRRDLIAPKPYRHLDRTDGYEPYGTPPECLEAARAVLGTIDLDPASSAIAQQRVQATRYYTEQDDGLAHEWHGTVWLNPPYGAPMARFLAKLRHHHEAGDVPAGIILVSLHAISAGWTAPLFDADLLCITDHRLEFIRDDGKPAATPYGSVFGYFGPEPGRFAHHFRQFGYILTRYY
jgi:ParB family chromosome partitioning protein